MPSSTTPVATARSSPPQRQWTVIVAFAVVLLVATVTRVIDLGARLTVDEAYSWLVASSPTTHVFLHRLAASENSPPLFYVLLALAHARSPSALRVPAVVPGVAVCLILFCMLHTRLGVRVAAVAALLVAAAPYLITYSDLARGFMLSNAALLVCAWMLLRVMDRDSLGSWTIFAVAAAVAVYTEYSSAIALAAMLVAAMWLGLPDRRRPVVVAALVVLAVAPWIPQIVRGQHQVGVTKLLPMHSAPSLDGLRDIAITLVAGERGGTSATAGRWLEFLVVLLVVGGAAWLVKARWPALRAVQRRTISLLTITALATLIGSAVAGLVGLDVFSQRYLTILVPLVAGPAAFSLSQIRIHSGELLAIGAILLTVLGLAEAAARDHKQFQPSLSPARAIVTSLHPRTVLTNTPLVLYYLASLHPIMDRPYNLGRGLQGSCARTCVVVDDSRVPGGTPRTSIGTPIPAAPFTIVVER